MKQSIRSTNNWDTSWNDCPNKLEQIMNNCCTG